jgi:hypothetical protein
MNMARSRWLLLACALGCASLPARADRKQRLVACVIDAPGSTKVAAPHIERFLAAIEKAMAWAPQTLRGLYTPKRRKCSKELRKKATTLAILSPEMFFAHEKRLRLRPIATAHVAGAATTHLNVVVKKGAVAALSELRGGRFLTNHGADKRFFARVVLAGALGDEVDVRRTRAPLRALRAVHRGEAKATVLDDVELEKMKVLPFADELHVLFRSSPIPNPVVVRVGARGGDSLARLGEKLASLCGAENKDVCEALRITGFGPVDEAALTALGRTLRSLPK